MTTPQAEYCTIPLTKGQVTLVDATDFDWLNQFKWCAQWNPCTRSFYAMRKIQRHTSLMHRVILGLQRGQRLTGDHVNHDTLDNRRINLRACTYSQNMQNMRLRRDSRSGFQGVTWHQNMRLWQARKTINGVQVHLGYRSQPAEARKLIDDFCAANGLLVVSVEHGSASNFAQNA